MRGFYVLAAKYMTAVISNMRSITASQPVSSSTANISLALIRGRGQSTLAGF